MKIFKKIISIILAASISILNFPVSSLGQNNLTPPGITETGIQDIANALAGSELPSHAPKKAKHVVTATNEAIDASYIRGLLAKALDQLTNHDYEAALETYSRVESEADNAASIFEAMMAQAVILASTWPGFDTNANKINKGVLGQLPVVGLSFSLNFVALPFSMIANIVLGKNKTEWTVATVLTVISVLLGGVTVAALSPAVFITASIVVGTSIPLVVMSVNRLRGVQKKNAGSNSFFFGWAEKLGLGNLLITGADMLKRIMPTTRSPEAVKKLQQLNAAFRKLIDQAKLGDSNALVQLKEILSMLPEYMDRINSLAKTERPSTKTVMLDCTSKMADLNSEGAAVIAAQERASSNIQTTPKSLRPISQMYECSL